MNAPSTENPLSHLLLGLREFPFSPIFHLVADPVVGVAGAVVLGAAQPVAPFLRLRLQPPAQSPFRGGPARQVHGLARPGHHGLAPGRFSSMRGCGKLMLILAY